MNKDNLEGTGGGFEAIALYADVDRNGFSDFPLSEEVIDQVKEANELSSEEKIELFNEKAAQLRLLAGDIREASSKEIVEIPGMGKYRFEFHGRTETGKDHSDDDISLSISRLIPRGAGPYATWLAIKRISEGPARLIKNNSKRLDLKKRKQAPLSGHFATLFDAVETVEAMHLALGLGKKEKTAV